MAANNALATRPSTQAGMATSPGGGPDSISMDVAEKVFIGGDLSQLSSQERLQYYQGLCRSLNLNPLTRPFDYIDLQGKLTLYAKKDATEQLRKINNVSVYKLEHERTGDLYMALSYARTDDGREDIDEGIVPLMKEDGEWATSSNNKRYFKKNGQLIPLQGEDLANAMLKAITKAKRRVTLSICGLGFLDESEVEGIAQARRVVVDPETGNILNTAPPVPVQTQPAAAVASNKVPPHDPVTGEILDPPAKSPWETFVERLTNHLAGIGVNQERQKDFFAVIRAEIEPKGKLNDPATLQNIWKSVGKMHDPKVVEGYIEDLKPAVPYIEVPALSGGLFPDE